MASLRREQVRLMMGACVLVGAVGLCLAQGRAAQGGRGQGGRGQGGGPGGGVFHTETPTQAGSVIVGRPTRSSVTLSLMTAADTDAVVVWGPSAAALPVDGRPWSLKAGQPLLLVVDGLKPDTEYAYEVRSRQGGQRILPVDGAGRFRTARSAGSGFVFTITADSHLDGNTSPDTYRQTMLRAAGDHPDLHVDLGDTFMTEKHPSRDDALKQYLAQRYYFGVVASRAALFLTLGNHDGEQPRGRGGRAGTADDLATWSVDQRRRYFPNPVPDASFYTGNADRRAGADLLQDYYAWEWGDALFIVLDPFWYSQDVRGQDDNWSRSLGDAQYQWLKRTLEASKAPLKFVFIHHLVGGLDPQCRGGVEAAPLYEWGGKNPDGSDGFKAHRPGWPAPIHQLLVQHKVAAVFHGHDHLYVKQDLDGIVYQEVPQPGNPRAGGRNAAEYGYKAGTILGGSGYLRVVVSGTRGTVEYVDSTGAVQHRYSVGEGGPASAPRKEP